ncbi:TetR/AcrR family transcriptional regulator [Streptomyces sp. NPDC049627]|uniref:TetR/AcrR family transcriptional regulator n=1 Tax=Streptomyces sp. NPDC049627 TaxID=3365595 RepID=UPI0037B88E4E
MSETTGRRERKKAQTRQALADAAMRLFTERGYDDVGVREVAAEADVAVTTLFKHFPSKEALVFDEDEDKEAALVAAVRDRAPGQSVLHALRDHLMRNYEKVTGDTSAYAAMMNLVNATPALQDYMHRMWLRHETALTTAITEAVGAPEGDARVAALAHFALEAPRLLHGREDPQRALQEIFGLLEHGWGDD